MKEAERKRKKLMTWWENTPAGKEYIERELGQMKRMTKIEASNLLFDIGHNCKSLEDDFSLSEALRQLEHYVEEPEESYWHTGTPTEKGWYLCVEKGQYTPYMLRVIDPPIDEDDEFDKVIVWHRIPDFKEEKE